MRSDGITGADFGFDLRASCWTSFRNRVLGDRQDGGFSVWVISAFHEVLSIIE